MKILMISPYMPWPLHVGSSVRIFNLLKGMAGRGHEIILLQGVNDLLADTEVEVKKLCKKIYKYNLPKEGYLKFLFRSIFSYKIYPALRFQDDGFRDVLSKILLENKFDIIWVNFAVVVDMLWAGLKNDVPVVLDQHESERLVYLGYLNRGSLLERIFAILNLAKLKNFEGKTFSKVNAVLSVSNVEAEVTKKSVKGNGKVIVVPNGVKDEFLDSSNDVKRKSNLILLCANMTVRRNIDAAVWFANKIFPIVKRVIPNVEFWIVGREPSVKVKKLSSMAGVKVVGTVENIKEYYDVGSVFVAPYRFGAGTKLKILEAMASGIPVVSTSVGCQGIDALDGEQILIGDSPKDFSEKIIDILSNKNIADK
ncbi:MAG: glycosyltransferase family 4 protein, partial [Candidatus Staskawiczbacteria bacterium]